MSLKDHDDMIAENTAMKAILADKTSIGVKFTEENVGMGYCYGNYKEKKRIKSLSLKGFGNLFLFKL